MADDKDKPMENEDDKKFTWKYFPKGLPKNILCDRGPSTSIKFDLSLTYRRASSPYPGIVERFFSKIDYQEILKKALEEDSDQPGEVTMDSDEA